MNKTYYIVSKHNNTTMYYIKYYKGIVFTTHKYEARHHDKELAEDLITLINNTLMCISLVLNADTKIILELEEHIE